ncbi:MAG: SMP-30/gluconolactonase/LRE family protein [Planctomycetota bacterium]|jgi:hypothetical protein
MIGRALLAFGLCISVAAAGEKAPGFAKKPTATKAGGKVKIEFAASGETDCAVYVLNSRGKVVRHLVAGVLGEKPPAPLKPGLSQSIEWDGRDDLGKPAAGGPFKVRVALGLKPAFAGTIGDNPARIQGVMGLACGPGGEVFAFHIYGGLHPGDASGVCSVYSREGKYLRTVVPYPANLPEEKLKGLKRLEIEPGLKVPFVYQGETRSLIPGVGNLTAMQPVVTADGKLIFAGLQEVSRYNQQGRIQVVALNAADGSPLDGKPLRTVLTESAHNGCLAVAPDGKTFYASFLRSRKKSLKATLGGTVFKFTLDDAKPTPFLKGGGVSEARGIAVDSGGNVYVADGKGGKVAVFKPDGSPLGEVEVTSPDRVQVHPKTGAVYVTSIGAKIKLFKFASMKASKPVASIDLPFFKKDGSAALALDASAEPPVLWYGEERGGYRKVGLRRIEDMGASFGDAVDINALNPGECGGRILNLSVNREKQLLLVGNRIYDLKSGKFGGGITAKGYSDIGADGNIFRQALKKTTARYGPDLKPLPFAKGEKGTLQGMSGTMRLRGRGATSDLHGNVYSLWEWRDAGISKSVGAEHPNALHKYAFDGALIKEKLVDSHIRYIFGPRVDPAGNIYVLVGARPGKELLPPGLKGKVPDGAEDPEAVRGVNYYPLMCGSVVKFGPEGGKIQPNVGTPCNFAFGRPIGIEGAKWIAPGASNVHSWRSKGTKDICSCESSRFDVDGFGRSFYPDAVRFRVGVLDTAGNRICTFGTYGNPDSAGPKSKVPTPEIPVYWVSAVAVDDNCAYIGDRLARRAVQVDLKYAAEETCPVR